MHGPSEISQFSNLILEDENIFWLQIPMNDVVLMQVFHGGYHLPDIAGDSSFVEPSHFLEKSVQLSHCGELHDYVNSPVVKEEPVHAQDVGVV